MGICLCGADILVRESGRFIQARFWFEWGPSDSPNTVIPTGADHRKAMICGAEEPAVLRRGRVPHPNVAEIIRSQPRSGFATLGWEFACVARTFLSANLGGSFKPGFGLSGGLQISQHCHPDRSRSSQSDDLRSGGTCFCGCPHPNVAEIIRSQPRSGFATLGWEFACVARTFLSASLGGSFKPGFGLSGDLQISQHCHPDRSRSSQGDDLRSGGTCFCGCPILTSRK